MKIRQWNQTVQPGYPTKRQFVNYGTVVGIAALALGGLIGGYAHAETRRVIAVDPAPIAIPDPPAPARPTPAVGPTGKLPAGATEGERRLKVELNDGTSIAGIPVVSNIAVRTAMGELSVPLANIASMTFSNQGNVSVTMANGDRISGVCSFEGLRLTTLMGDLTVPAKMLSKIVCSHARALNPDVLRANANTCINNLRQLEAAKDQYALEAGLSNDSHIAWTDIGPTNTARGGYLKAWPRCPESPTFNAGPSATGAQEDYELNAVGVNPRCRHCHDADPPHVLP
jgi:hypothetical protein